MSIDFVRPEVDELRPRICVIGVGGAGGNAVANMIGAGVLMATIAFSGQRMVIGKKVLERNKI